MATPGTITLTISDITRAITGLCGAYKIDPTAANAKSIAMTLIVNTVKQYEAQTAKDNAIAGLAADLTIT